MDSYIEVSATARISFVKNTPRGRNQSDSNSPETAYIENDEVLYVLNGDFRETVKEILQKGQSVKRWFSIMEKEWGSSWSKGSTREMWEFERVK